MITFLKRYVNGPTIAERIAKDLERTKVELYNLRLAKEDLQAREMTLKSRATRLENEMIQEMEVLKNGEVGNN